MIKYAARTFLRLSRSTLEHHKDPVFLGTLNWNWAGFNGYRCLSGASVLSLEAKSSFAGSDSSSLRGNIHARAAPAVPSPLWREKQRKVAQTKAQQPVKVVRTYRGTRAKFRNWRRQKKISHWIGTRQSIIHVYLIHNEYFASIAVSYRDDK